MERLGNLPVRSQTAPTKITTPTATATPTIKTAVSNSVPNITRTDEEGKVIVGERETIRSTRSSFLKMGTLLSSLLSSMRVVKLKLCMGNAYDRSLKYGHNFQLF